MIADLTCDSDGRIDTYVECRGARRSLPLHAPREGESYRLGIFLVGAYQETLGDIHNLFGDTDTANVRLDADGGYTLERQRRGDTTDVMLDYVGYPTRRLRDAYRDEGRRRRCCRSDEAMRLPDALEAGLTGYTYLHEHDPA